MKKKLVVKTQFGTFTRTTAREKASKVAANPTQNFLHEGVDVEKEIAADLAMMEEDAAQAQGVR